MDDLIARLRKGFIYGDPRNVGVSGELDEAETYSLMIMAATALHEAYEKISDQRAELDSLNLALTEAIRLMGAYARDAGEAKGKLEGSEIAGAVEGWKNRAVKAERELDLRRSSGLGGSLVDRWVKWCSDVELAELATKPSSQRSQDELDRVLMKAAELLRTGAHQ